MKPGKAIKQFMDVLTDYEKGEILDFKEVYFVGPKARKIKGSPLNEFNFGYDDERGDYLVQMHDHMAYRFEVVDFLGKGSFGQALKCWDHKNNEYVALKVIRNKKRFYYQAGVEVKVLAHLRDNDPHDHQNIIRMKDYVVFRKHLVLQQPSLICSVYYFRVAQHQPIRVS